MKYLTIIFALFFFSCLEEEQYCDYCTLELEAPDLELDENGYYHMTANPDLTYNMTQLRAYVGYQDEYVGWTTDTYHSSLGIPIIGGSGYSSEDGYAYALLTIDGNNIGDRATIWVGYYDNYGKQWIDSIKVVIE